MNRTCFFSILLAVFFSCEKEEENYQSTAVITGPDVGYCICCGGYFIEIEDSTYHFDNLPDTSEIDLPNEDSSKGKLNEATNPFESMFS